MTVGYKKALGAYWQGPRCQTVSLIICLLMGILTLNSVVMYFLGTWRIDRFEGLATESITDDHVSNVQGLDESSYLRQADLFEIGNAEMLGLRKGQRAVLRCTSSRTNVQDGRAMILEHVRI